MQQERRLHKQRPPRVQGCAPKTTALTAFTESLQRCMSEWIQMGKRSFILPGKSSKSNMCTTLHNFPKQKKNLLKGWVKACDGLPLELPQVIRLQIYAPTTQRTSSQSTTYGQHQRLSQSQSTNPPKHDFGLWKEIRVPWANMVRWAVWPGFEPGTIWWGKHQATLSPLLAEHLE